MTTPTLRLRRLALNNFRGFVGTHSLDLPESGLHMVFGLNEDTGESSGAGKSSLVEALAFAFDYATFTATDLQSWPWLTKDPLGMELELDAAGHGNVTVKRGKKASVTIRSGEVKATVTSTKEVKATLRSIVGVEPDILKALTYRAQGQPGLFLTMTDGEKKSFLTGLLGLRDYEAEVERVTKAITELEKQVEVKRALAEQARGGVPVEPTPPQAEDLAHFDTERERLRGEAVAQTYRLKQLKAEEERLVHELAAREERVRETYQPLIDRLTQARIDIAMAPVGVRGIPEPEEPAALGDLTKKRALIQDKMKELRNAHLAKVKLKRTELDTLRNFVQGLRIEASKEDGLQEKCGLLEGQLAHFRAEMCPTCERPWADEKTKRIIETKEEELAIIRERLHKAQLAAGEVTNLTAQGQQLKSFVEALEAESGVPEKLAQLDQQFADNIAGLRATFEAARQSVARERQQARQVAESERRAKVAEADGQLSQAKADFAQALAVAQQMPTEHEQLRDQMAQVKVVMERLMGEGRANEQARQEVQRRNQQASQAYLTAMEVYQRSHERALAAESDRDSVQGILDGERDYVGCLKGFLGAIFDETLDRIAYLTNERLARVPNVQNLTLRFVSERETKTTGTLRQEIKAVVEKEGHEVPLKAGTSGGQYSALELAVDLSLADVIAERTGVMPGWLVLDESFNGLPVKSKKACLELLKDAAETRLILIIDHATELQTMFDSTITVRSRNGLSRFE